MLQAFGDGDKTQANLPARRVKFEIMSRIKMLTTLEKYIEHEFALDSLCFHFLNLLTSKLKCTHALFVGKSITCASEHKVCIEDIDE